MPDDEKDLLSFEEVEEECRKHPGIILQFHQGKRGEVKNTYKFVVFKETTRDVPVKQDKSGTLTTRVSLAGGFFEVEVVGDGQPHSTRRVCHERYPEDYYWIAK
jgi:hypothetical protein